MSAREDFRQKLTNALIESIEENDGLPWERGWDSMAARPFNPVKRIRFRGGNVINLMLEQINRNSDDSRWMTLKQANSAGYRVRKGAKAAYVEYWDWGQKETRKPEVDEKGNPIPRIDTGEDEDEEQAERRTKPRVFFSAVFNGSDIIGLPEIKREISWQPNTLAEKLIAATGAEIEHRALSRVGLRLMKDAAYYTPGLDKIIVPPKESFNSEGDYYATVLHELAHWTGHPSRLARLNSDEFGLPAYAMEELRADIASLILNSMLGIEGKIQNHAKYTAGWLEKLKGDKHEIFRASSDAEKIVNHIFEYAPELREVVESLMVDNSLTDQSPTRKLDSGISPDMPNFTPPELQSQDRTGRDDPRWESFNKTVRDEARKFGVDNAVVDRALEMIESRFTDVMDAAEKNGYTLDDMNGMLAQSIVDEMRTAEIRQQQWEKFCEQVRQAGADLYSIEQIELALQELGGRYQQLIEKSTQAGWDKKQTDTEIRSMIYGEEGRRPITGEFVKSIIENSSAVRELIIVPAMDDDDDFVLRPIGLPGELSDDAGIIADELIGTGPYIMDDAEVQIINTP